MALSFSHVASWIDRGRANLRVGYTDVTFDDHPSSGVWSVDADNFSKGIVLLKVFPENYALGVSIQTAVDSNGDVYLSGWKADGSAVTADLDGETIRFYWEGY